MDKITAYCTGCRTCEQLCPKSAISLKSDGEGFLTAVVDNELCIDCGLCQKRCPQNTDIAKGSPLRVVAARYKDDKELYKSASGGAFVALATAIIDNGGIVFGVVYDKDWNAVFVSASTREELQPILSSKYVQADTRRSFSEVKEQLHSGKKVLFAGTSCQIAGLKAFLKTDSENLITIDIICHGVTSPLLFQKYISWLGEKHGTPILEYDFRDKRGGWGLGYKYKFKSKYKYKYNSCNLDPYYFLFLSGDAYRECCYQCKYCRENRVGDITIGDYWGIEKEHPQFFSTKGVSVIIANNEKGKDILNQFENFFYVCDSTFEKASSHNHNLVRPTIRHASLRDHVYDDILKSSFANMNFVKNFKPTISARIKSLVPLWVKLLMKKF